jgi:hypothetical protein
MIVDAALKGIKRANSCRFSGSATGLPDRERICSKISVDTETKYTKIVSLVAGEGRSQRLM